MIIKDTEKIAEELKHATTPEETVRVIENYFSEQWKNLDNDPQKILDDVRETVNVFCDRSITTAIRLLKSGSGAGDVFIEKDGYISFDIEKMTNLALGLVDDHRLFFNHERDEEIDQIVRGTVIEAERSSKIKIIEESDNDLPDVRSRGSYELVVITSKLAHQVFHNFLQERGKKVNVQKKKSSKKNPVEVLTTINYDNLPKNIKINKELSQYEQAIHDYVASRYLEGNEYISDSMIFDVASGKDGATLNPEGQKAISEAMTKMMYSQISIDASAETRVFGVDKFIYDGALIPAERVTIMLNGKKTECYHLFRTPPLYDYANRLNQIGRESVKLLSSPVNKNKQTIALQDDLLRRIKAMKSNTKLNRTILYDSIYSIFDFSTVNSDEALRNKKKNIRDTTKKILKYWVEQDFIRDFYEITKDRKKKDLQSKGQAVGIVIEL